MGLMFLRLLPAWVVGGGVAVADEELDVDVVLGAGVGGSGDGCGKRAALLDMCRRCVRKKKKKKSDGIAYLWLTSLLPLVALSLDDVLLVVVVVEEEDVDWGRGSCGNVILAWNW